MNNTTTLGIDLAKNVFQLHGVDRSGKVTLRKRLQRPKLLPFLANLPPCLIGIEACSGAHRWQREMEALGHDVRQMNPAFVKPYRKVGKNDSLDAEAICEAVARPTMRFVTCKSQEQLDTQALHRVRERLVKSRTALSNQARGILAEHGIIVPQSLSRLRQALSSLAVDLESGLTEAGREIMAELWEELRDLDARIVHKDKQLQEIASNSEACVRLMSIPGVGAMTATAMVAAIGDARQFDNSRQLAAWIGLVPRQHSSGGTIKLLGITKRGDRYLRTLLAHCARSVLFRARTRNTAQSRWLAELEKRRGAGRAIIAMANKIARTCWALLVKGKTYQPAA